MPLFRTVRCSGWSKRDDAKNDISHSFTQHNTQQWKLHILNSITMIKVHVYVRENLSAWLEARIVKALHERHPEVPRKPQWNKPQTDKWSGNPNNEEAQGSTAEAINKGQKTADNNRKKRVREVHSVVINKLGKLVRARRAMNCWWLGDHIWIGNLREKTTLPINLKE